MTATTSYSQIVNLGFIYATGLLLTQTGNTTLNLAPGQARDVTNTFDIVVPSPITISSAGNGVNGLDTGTIAANSVYAVHLIYDVTNNLPPAALLSLSATQPYLPAGYGYFQRIGWWTTNNSANFVVINTSGDGLTRTYYYDTAIQVVNNLTTNTQTPLPLGASVPPISNIPVILKANITPNAAGDTLSIWPSGSTSTTEPKIYGQVASVLIEEQITVPAKLISSVATIDYALSTASAHTTIYVYGFVDSI